MRGTKRNNVIRQMLMILLSIILSIPAGLFVQADVDANSVQNLTWSLTLADGTIPSVDMGASPASYPVGISYAKNCYAVINFIINATPGETL